jgi:HK97 family phage major capsid protein
MKIKDGDGRRLWQPSQLASEPNRLDGHPVIESEYVPHVFTASLYVGVFGDFDRYWIIDSLAMSLQVVLELYALTNQNGYISRAESDGMPVSSAAFRRVKLAA